MGVIMDAEGRVTDKELNNLGIRIQSEVNNLLNAKTDWTIEQKIVAAFHLQGYINTEIMRRILENVVKKSGNASQLPTLKPQQS